MTRRKNKNISKRVPIGALIHSNDNYFQNTDHQSNKDRMAAVIETNRKDELAVSKLTTSTDRTLPLLGYRQGKSLYNPETVYIADDEGNAITLGVVDSKGRRKFRLESNIKKHLSRKQANEIKKESVKNERFGKRNKYRLEVLKGRKK